MRTHPAARAKYRSWYIAGPITVRINAKNQIERMDTTNQKYGSLYPLTTPNQVCIAIARTKKPLATSLNPGVHSQ